MSTARMRVKLAATEHWDGIKKTTGKEVARTGASLVGGFTADFTANHYLYQLSAIHKAIQSVGKWCPIDHIIGKQQVNLQAHLIHDYSEPASPTWCEVFKHIGAELTLDTLAATLSKAIYIGINGLANRNPHDTHEFELELAGGTPVR